MARLRRIRLRHGVAREIADHRDHDYVPPAHVAVNLPRSVDLRPPEWPVWNQGGLNSCTAQAICGAEMLVRMRERLPQPFVPSRLFLYFNERVREDKVDDNAPVYMRDGIKTLARVGVCAETQWPYDGDPNTGKFKERPPAPVYTAAHKHRAWQYGKVQQDLGHLKACLTHGYPVTIALVLYSGDGLPSMPMDGDLTMPDPAREHASGGHAVLIVGYDDAKERFLIRNSVGDGWGEKGYGTVPYAYAVSPEYADSLWTLRLVT